MVETQLRRQAGQSPLIDDLLASASHVVSRAVRHVGFALMADSDVAVLHHIDFVPLGGSRVLVVVVSRGGQVTQKVIDAGDGVRQDDLVRAANYLNSEFAGLALYDVREAVLARLEQERTLYDELMTRALRLACLTLAELPKHQTFYVEGAASLLNDSAHEGVSLSTLRALLEMMEEKECMVHLLNEYIDGPGLTIVIGAEHTAANLRPFSLIASTAVDGSAMRTVGVIGPTRMRYSRAIALVDGATQAVSRVLRDGN
jgi:heat-inducible transcriptional repressor